MILLTLDLMIPAAYIIILVEFIISLQHLPKENHFNTLNPIYNSFTRFLIFLALAIFRHKIGRCVRNFFYLVHFRKYLYEINYIFSHRIEYFIVIFELIALYKLYKKAKQED